MTLEERERLRVLRAEGGDVRQLQVSPHQGRLTGPVLPARLVGSRALDRSG